jgi:hypothetical protein
VTSLATVVIVAMVIVTVASAAATASPDTTASAPHSAVVHASEAMRQALERGQAVYDISCAPCHGGTGQGFAEARAAFPANHYDCQRCHRHSNPARMSLEEIERLGTAFSIGDPPALAGVRLVERFGSPRGLLAYVESTMPRWAPGSLDAHDLRVATAYVLALDDALPDDASLTTERLYRD